MDRRSTKFGIHFPKAVFVSSVLLSICLVIIFKKMVHFTPADRQEYSRLMAAANPMNERNNSSYSATQHRAGIRKDYFYFEGIHRLHLRLQSDNAVLMMEHSSDRSNLVEKMNNVKCHMQEDLYYLLSDGRQAIKLPDGQLALKSSSIGEKLPLPLEETINAIPMQQIRYFESHDASYHYKSDQLYANNVKIVRYIATGHLLPIDDNLPTGSMNGIAKNIEFNLKGDNLNFKATCFKAQFNNIGEKL